MVVITLRLVVKDLVCVTPHNQAARPGCQDRTKHHYTSRHRARLPATMLQQKSVKEL